MALETMASALTMFLAQPRRRIRSSRSGAGIGRQSRLGPIGIGGAPVVAPSVYEEVRQRGGFCDHRHGDFSATCFRDVWRRLSGGRVSCKNHLTYKCYQSGDCTIWILAGNAC